MRITIRQLFVILLFLGLLIMTLRPIADPDFWWHLRTGQQMVETQTIPRVDPFSFTNTGKTWIAHEWLSELFIYSIYSLGGMGPLILSFAVIITAAFVFVYLQTPGKPYVAGFSLLLGAIATAPTWGVRPQMISVLLSSIFLYLLDRFQNSRQIKFLLPLPLVTMLWVNLHAGFMLGLAMVGIYMAGDLVDFFRSRYFNSDQSHPPSLKNLGSLGGVLGVSILAAIVNPNGIRLFTYPLETLTSQSMQQFIQEWFSPDFHQVIWQPLAWFLLALLTMGMLGHKPISSTKIFLTLSFGYAALHSMRHVPLFALVAIPVLAEEIISVIGDKIKIQHIQGRLSRLNLLLMVIFLFAAGLRFFSVVQEQPGTEREKFPAAAADWIVKFHPEGNMFNTYGWGGYLIWRLYPAYRVYIDGRADVYGDEFIYNYLSIYRADQGWDSMLEANNVRFVLIEPQSPLAIVMKTLPEWKIAYSDRASIIFVRR